MKTLHELAIKLQESIIKQQEDAHNSATLNVTKYNNLKLKMDTRYEYPHVIVIIGISEAVFNIADGTKTNGALGPDEKYVRKWLAASTTVSDLKEIYISISELVKAEDEDKAVSQEGEADEAKREAPRRIKKYINTDGSPIEGLLAEGDEYDEDEEDEESDLGLISLEEETKSHHNTSHKTSDPETVDEIKKDLKNYLRSIYRRK